MLRFDARSLNRLRCLALAARRAGGGMLARPPGNLPAGGTELTGHRDYAPGDDYRRVDWNLCARHDELLVKQYGGEAECPAYLLIDGSESMAAGNPAKFDVARQVALALAYVALMHSERVSVLAFSDRLLAQFGPVGDKNQVDRLARFLKGLSTRGGKTDLAAAAKAFVLRRQRPGLAIVVSDLYDPRGFRAGLEVLRHRGYHARVVHLSDPRDAEPGTLGDTELVDVETGATWQIPLTEEHARRYRRRYAEFHDSVRSYCAGRGVACAQVPIDLSEERLLLAAVGATK